ncbi:hypothetical protein Afil01_64480 [Actinorhabdospora filicis]|uniref:Chitin-binding type-3 domain-containing protein n=1 Tax=Actinorhabdospora filicis TaxID=1785913 RepID=A0A9W6SVR6_9ACTN|nr:alpha-lytic protease prodomain-containing protein [Actinorhabdospora filicis]GLZ81641.1 hypothetical protein Afil01_64480 [Actinorhabdospora filicis]
MRTRFIGLACALGLAAAALAAPAAQAGPGPSTPDTGRLLQHQDAALRQLSGLPAWARERSPGQWLDANGDLVVAATTADADAVRALGARVQVVARGKAELDGALARVTALLPPAPTGINSWGVDPVANAVSVQVTPAADPALVARLRAVEGVTLVTVEGSPHQQSGTVQPGNPWWPGSESNCSVGFPVTDAQGGKHFLTAGHCTNDVNQAAYGESGQRNRLGTSNVGGSRSVNAREGDMGVVAVTETGWTLSAAVNTWGGTPVTVTGSTEPVVGQTVCHSGNTSKWSCGTVRRVNQTINYGNVIIDGLATSTACSLGGDSGGAWLAGDKAVGLHSGGPSQCVDNPGPDDESIFQPVNEALGKWGLTLYTGAPTGNDFSVGVSPASLSVERGRSGAVTVSTQVTSGSAQQVALSASGLPTGVTASFSPATVTAGQSATLTLTASANATTGPATITVLAHGTSADRSASLALTVGGPPSGCTAPAWNATVWYQAGAVVAHKGHTWRATWAAYNIEPGGSWDWGRWSDLGAC